MYLPIKLISSFPFSAARIFRSDVGLQVPEVTQVGGKGRGGRCTYLVSDLRRRGAGGRAGGAGGGAAKACGRRCGRAVYGVGEEDRGDAGGFGGLDRVGNYIPIY
jgi:hypothetical protein